MAAAVVLLVLPGKTQSPTTGAASIPDLIVVTSPLPNDPVVSAFVVKGEARGPWFFEASFPIELRNALGEVIAQGYGQAQGEWMTTEFVRFESIPLAFPTQPKGSVGSLVLHKDNPSGLPEHDRSLTLPVVF